MNSDTVKFSVVIPLYNKAPHVERAVRSVLEQDYPATEIIVVDDASTDGGCDLVRRFEKVRIISRSEPGPGGYAARNVGIEASSSEWIAFLDADDRWLPDHLATLAAAIQANKGDVGCAFTQPVFVEGGVDKPYPLAKHLQGSTCRLDLNRFVAAWLDARTCPMWTGSVAIRRSALITAGKFPAGAARRGGDKDVWLRVLALTNAVMVPKVTTEFHQDAVNRVTHSLDHSVQPVICQTIRHLLPRVERKNRRLLRRLNNMEVVHYARYAAGAGAPFNRQSLPTLCGLDVRPIAALLTYAVAGRVLRLLNSMKPREMERTSGVPVNRQPATRPMVRGLATSPSFMPDESRLRVTQVAGAEMSDAA